MSEKQLGLFDEDDPKPLGKPRKESLLWRDKYNQVIASPRWKKLRARLIEKADRTCCRCKWKKESWDKTRTLDVHHKTYERLGYEWDSDLEVVCSRCHAVADIERSVRAREEAQRRGQHALYNARFNGWASKVYGEDFDDSDEYKHDQFQDWIERQSE